MARLIWDQIGKRMYETGVDHGVLYPRNKLGAYPLGVAWNGLTTVTESPTGAEPTALYADNIKYLTLMSAEEFGASIEAYAYPDEFIPCDGSASLVVGLYVGQQTRQSFGFSYRTILGNDIEGNDFGYKLHLIYGALASPSDKSYSTVNDSPEAITFSWEVTTTPVEASGMKTTASLTIDSTKVKASKLKKLENILYGTELTQPRLPMPDEVADIMTSSTIIDTSVQWDLSSIIANSSAPWLDEDDVLENVRYAFIVPDLNATTTLISGYQYYLSDGSYYNGDSTVTHVWDQTKDKDSEEGYKTRCVVVCNVARDVTVSLRTFATSGIDCTETYFGDCNVTSLTFSGSTAAANNILKSVTFGDLTTVNASALTSTAFLKCTSLLDVDIPEGIVTIPSRLFSDCTGLESITIPSSVTTLASDAFQNCYTLKAINLPQNFGLSLTLDGTISISLSVACLEDMAAKYADMTSQTSPVLTIGAVNIAKLSSEVAATFASKNITLA